MKAEMIKTCRNSRGRMKLTLTLVFKCAPQRVSIDPGVGDEERNLISQVEILATQCPSKWPFSLVTQYGVSSYQLCSID